MGTLDDDIARYLAAADLKAAEGYGKPLPEVDGWDETPAALRMPFKILKDSGYAPPEVLMFRQRADLRARLATAPAAARPALELELAALEQKIALRLESLRANPQL